jgi:Kef-type K+ transport system membrane component KefB
MSTIGSISLGIDFVAGKKRVPRPAAGMTAFRTRGALMRGTLSGCVPRRQRRYPAPVLPHWIALAIALGLAKVSGEAAHRARLPPVLGELFAGLLLGALGRVASLGPALATVGLERLGDDPGLELLAGLGAVLLLFQVGLESDARKLLGSGFAAVRVAAVGVVASFALGWLAIAAVSPSVSPLGRLFVATALAATSAGIAGRVLRDLGAVDSPSGHVILGAAVADDLLGLILLAIVTGLAASGHAPSGRSIARMAGVSLLFLGGGIAIGRLVARPTLALAAKGTARGWSIAIGLTTCFGVAGAASAVGLEPIIGAFAAGLMLDPLFERALVDAGHRGVRTQVEALGAFLVPLFFVRLGALCDLRALDAHGLALAGALTLAAIAGKLATAPAAGKGNGRLAVALGMLPRGEVTLIVVAQGAVAAADRPAPVDARTFAAIVVVVILTTALSPILLARRLRAAQGGSSGAT